MSGRLLSLVTVARPPIDDDPFDYDAGDDLEENAGDLEGSALGEWGCLFPDRCVMAGEHFTSECFTAEDAEEWWGSVGDE